MEYRLLILIVALFVCAASRPPRAPDGFSQQMARLISTRRLPQAKLQALPMLVQHLELILGTRWPGSRVEVFGSIATGLAAADSDADCTLFLPRRRDTSAALASETRATLQMYPELFTGFQDYPWVALPVFKFKHIPTQFNVDLTINNYNGKKSVEFLNEIFRSERIYSLTFTVKYWAKVHELTRSDSLPSYGLVALVLFYVQQRGLLPPVQRLQQNSVSYFVDGWNYGFNKIDYSEAPNDIPLKSLLGGFFEYYSKFDFDKYIVSPYIGHPVEKKLFENVNGGVPEGYNCYMQKVNANLSQPLSLDKSMIIQDFFVHNVNLAQYVDAKSYVNIISYFNNATKIFHGDNGNFLLQILQI